MAFFDNIKFPFFTMQELNLDWLLKEVKRIAGYMPQDGNVGDVLTRKSDGAEWEPPDAVNININALPEDTAITDNDQLVFYDISASANRKIKPPNLLDSMMSNGTPLMDGTASAGTSKKPARYDHKHPTDTSRQAALSGTQMNAVNSGAPASCFDASGILKAANGGAPANAFDGSGILDTTHGGTGANNIADARTNLKAGFINWDPIYMGNITSGKTVSFSGNVMLLLISDGNNTARQGAWIVYGTNSSNTRITPIVAASDVTVTATYAGFTISATGDTFGIIIPLSTDTDARLTIT